MKWIALPILLLALAACGTPAYDPVRAARDEAEIARIETEAARAAQLAPLYTALTGLAYMLLGAGAVGSATYLGALAYFDVRQRATTVMPTHDGRLPVPIDLLPAASVAAPGATHARLQFAATDQPMERALTFDAQLVGLLEAPPAK